VQNHVAYETVPKSYKRVFMQTLINVIYDTIRNQKSEIGQHAQPIISDNTWILRLLLKYTKLLASDSLIADEMVHYSYIENLYTVDDEYSVYDQCESIVSGGSTIQGCDWKPRANKNCSILDLVKVLKSDCANSIETIDSGVLESMRKDSMVNCKIASIQIIQECDCIIQILSAAQMRANGRRRISALTVIHAVGLVRPAIRLGALAPNKSGIYVFLNAMYVQPYIKCGIAEYL
jgi:hypothetical protein